MSEPMHLVFQILLVLGLALGAVAVAWLINRWVLRMQRSRHRYIADVDNFDALTTPAQVGSDHAAERANAQRRVHLRFSVIRRTLVFAVLFIGLLVAVVPLLDTVSATMVSVFAGALSVVIGIAARPFLENFISGIVLSLSNRIHIGDTIYIDGRLGTIEDVTVTHTIIRIWDWQRYVLPNGLMLNKEIYNCSHRDGNLWAYIEFHIAYDQDIDLVRRLAIEVAKNSPHFVGREDPEMWVIDLGNESITCWLAAWVSGPETLWYMRNDMRTGLARAFREHGIETHHHSWRTGVDDSQWRPGRPQSRVSPEAAE